MNTTFTDLPLHEVILQIMFYENMVKAAEMTSADILWRIDNPEISERQVREVLDWLVRQKKVTQYLGKYSIDRIEFLAQKEKYETTKKKHSKLKKKIEPAPNTFYMEPPKEENNSIPKYLLIIGFILLSYLTYTISDLYHIFTNQKKITTTQLSITNKLVHPRSLYLSEDIEYTEEEKKAISSSFFRQNQINKKNTAALNQLQVAVDSITKTYNNELKFFQKELHNYSYKSNKLLKKIMYSNIIIILLFVFLFFRFYV